MSSSLDTALLAYSVRKERGSKTLRDVAALTGISPSTLSRIERGMSACLNLETYLTLCDWLDVSPASFIFTDNKAAPALDEAGILATGVRTCSQLPSKVAAALADLIELFQSPEGS